MIRTIIATSSLPPAIPAAGRARLPSKTVAWLSPAARCKATRGLRALKTLMENKGRLGTRAEAALEELLAESSVKVLGKFAAKAFVPALVLTELVFADEVNADDDSDAIQATQEAAERMFGKPIESLDGRQLQMLWEAMSGKKRMLVGAMPTAK